MACLPRKERKFSFGEHVASLNHTGSQIMSKFCLLLSFSPTWQGAWPQKAPEL